MNNGNRLFHRVEAALSDSLLENTDPSFFLLVFRLGSIFNQFILVINFLWYQLERIYLSSSSSFHSLLARDEFLSPPRAIVPSAYLHLGSRDGNPFIFGAIKPGESEVITAIKVSMLAVRKPPTTLIIGGAVGVADVAVRILGRELHAILIVEGVTRIARITRYVNAVAIVSWRDVEFPVLGHPSAVVDVTHLDPQGRTVVRGEQV